MEGESRGLVNALRPEHHRIKWFVCEEVCAAHSRTFLWMFKSCRA